MTLNQWLDRVSGYTITVPVGTDVRLYTSDRTLDRDTLVTITLDHREVRQLIAKALHNKSRRSRDGALTVKIEGA